MRKPVIRDKVLHYLRARFPADAPAVPVKLPPVRSLSAQAGVSIYTMSRALNCYARENPGLRVIPNRGCWLASSSEIMAASGPPAPTGKIWERLADTLRMQILTGRRYADGAAVPVSSIAAGHGVARPTAAKALRQLMKDGVVRRSAPSPRRRPVPRPAAAAPGA